MSTWKEVMDVVDHSFGHWTGSTQDHGGVTFDGCIDHQAVKELPNTTRVAAVLGRRAFASHPLWRAGFKWFVNGFQFLHLKIEKIVVPELWLLFHEGVFKMYSYCGGSKRTFWKASKQKKSSTKGYVQKSDNNALRPRPLYLFHCPFRPTL